MHQIYYYKYSKRSTKKTKFINNNTARLDSTRLSKKLIRKISGVPMIMRVAESAFKTKLGDVLVATDSKQIQNLCKNEKVDSVITPTDIKSGTDRSSLRL